MWKIAPALLAGNTIVLKPSPYTPITSLMLGEILRDIVPPGVFNVVSGGDELGAMMTSHPVPRKLSFTGSVETGKNVAAAAAPDLKRVHARARRQRRGDHPGRCRSESGRAEDFLGRVREQRARSAARSSASMCPRQMYNAMIDNLGDIAKSVKVGDGLVAGNQLGPINNKPQFERVTELVEDAKKHGAKIVTGGARVGKEGYFFRRRSSETFPMACGWSTKSSSARRSRSFLTRMSTTRFGARTRPTTA